MRLGEHNFSHGRTSASTLDDAFSGRADVASSATSEDGDDSENTEQPCQPLPRVQPKLECSPSTPANYMKRHYKHSNDPLPSFDSTEQSGGEADGDYQYDDKKDGFFKSDPDDRGTEFGHPLTGKLAGSKYGHNIVNKSRNSVSSKKNVKPAKPRTGSMNKKPKLSPIGSGTKVPPSPTSTPEQPRKTSSASTLNFQHHLGADEEDLSSKPRCQRCRKSKKGCDRQRPCQRCKDAGIGPEGCVSEDEGNGRKGRFGRHMGVSVKKDHCTAVESEAASAVPTAMATTVEKSKKRKR